MIQAYPDETSANPGDQIHFRVSTDAPQFRIDVYRQGETLDFILSTNWLEGNFADDHDHDQDWGVTAVRRDGKQVAGWAVYPFEIPGTWASGVYIAMLVEGDGQGNPNPNQNPPLDTSTADARTGKALFVVKNPAPGIGSQVLYKVPLFTYQSYNYQGGGSIYQGVDVTLHRPGGGTGGTPWDSSAAGIFNNGTGKPDVLDPTSPRQTFAHWDAKMVSWLESNGYRVDYCTDWDVHSDTGLEMLSPYALILSIGHDEYYSAAMRNNLERYVAGGGNIAFLSGNTCWWRTEFAANDPFRLLGQQTIKNWFYPVNNPEDSLTGVSFRNGGERNFPLPNNDATKVGYTVQNTQLWPFERSGLQENETFGKDQSIVGYECDGTPYDKNAGRPVAPKFNPIDNTPAGLVILGTADVSPWPPDGTVDAIPDDKHPEENIPSNVAATMALYSKGGTVFTAATTDWARVLAQGEAATATITRNVLNRLGARPKGLSPLTNLGGAVACDGFYSSDDGFRHGLVGNSDGNVTEIFFNPNSGTGQTKVASMLGLVDVAGFFTEDDGFRHALLAGGDGSLAEVFFSSSQGSGRTNLGNFPGLVRVAGFFTPDDGYRHAIIATADGALSELFFNPKTGQGQSSLGNFDGIVDIGGFYSADDNARHAIVAAVDGDIWEVFFSPAIGIGRALLGNVPGVTRIAAFYVSGDRLFSRRVILSTNDGRIHQIKFSPTAGVIHSVLMNTQEVVDLGAFHTPDDNFRHVLVALSDGSVQELFYDGLD